MSAEKNNKTDQPSNDSESTVKLDTGDYGTRVETNKEWLDELEEDFRRQKEVNSSDSTIMDTVDSDRLISMARKGIKDETSECVSGGWTPPHSPPFWKE